LISVIIPTRNRADLLAPVLESLIHQTLSVMAFEILLIDNGSTDRTAQVAQLYGQRMDNLRYFYEPEPGLHMGRHKGMLEARGEILVFADDDIEAFPTWLASIQEAFAAPDVAMVGGNNLPLFLEPPPRWLKKMWERSTYGNGRALPALSILELNGGVRALSPYMVWGCNFSIRKSVLLKASGFHPDGMPKELIRFRGDGEMHVSRYVAESAMTCLFHPGATVFHKVTPERMSLAYFHQRGFNQGVSDSYTALRKQDGGKQVAHKNFFYRVLRWGWRKLKLLRPVDANIRLAQRALTNGHAEGYAYHQNAYRNDTAVCDWVHKPKYFTESITQ
jgi:glucosyl-dolichyl phosphate glucuronosyltransferase